MFMEMMTVLGLIASPAGINDAAIVPESNESDRTTATAMIRTAPLILIQNRLFTLARVEGGKERLFLIDNGCDYTMLDPQLANESNFDERKELLVNMSGKRGLLTKVGVLSSISFGNLELRQALIRLSPLMKSLSRQLRRRIHGIVGMRQMASKLTTIDFSSGRIIFRPHNKATLDELLSRPSTLVLPLGEDHGLGQSKHICTIPISINGHNVDAVIDLGFSGAIMTNLSAGDLGIERGMSRVKFPVAFGGFTGEGCKGSADSVSVGQHTYRGVTVIHLKSSKAPPTTIIGVDFLKRFDITFDFINQQLILHPVAS